MSVNGANGNLHMQVHQKNSCRYGKTISAALVLKSSSIVPARTLHESVKDVPVHPRFTLPLGMAPIWQRSVDFEDKCSASESLLSFF